MPVLEFSRELVWISALYLCPSFMQSKLSLLPRPAPGFLSQSFTTSLKSPPLPTLLKRVHKRVLGAHCNFHLHPALQCDLSHLPVSLGGGGFCSPYSLQFILSIDDQTFTQCPTPYAGPWDSTPHQDFHTWIRWIKRLQRLMQLCSVLNAAAWMGWEFGGEWIHIYLWLSPFTVLLKLPQCFINWV